MRKQIITVQLMDDKDYLQLDEIFPNIKKEDLQNSLGFADKEAGEAYVRRTAVKDLDDATIQHEIQEILAETSSDEKDGIRYGWFRKIFGFSSQPAVRVIAPIIAAAIPGIGPVISGLLAAGVSAIAQKTTTGKISPLQTGLAGLGGGLLKAGMAPGIEASKAATTAAGIKPSLLGQTLTGLKSAVGMTPAATGADLSKGAFSLTGDVAPGLPTATAIKAGAIIPMAGSPFIPSVSPILGSAVGQGISSTLAPATQAGAQAGAGGAVTPPPAPTIGQKLGTILTKPENILGGGALLASTAMKQPEYPEFPVEIEAIRTGLMSGEGVSPLAQQARANLSDIMSKKPEELYPVGVDAYYNAALRQTRLAYKRAQEALAVRYNLVDPNYAQSGEYQELARRLDAELANVEADYTQVEEQRRFELARSSQYQAIRDALAVTDADMQELLGFTRLTVEQAAEKYKVAAADVEEIRRALGGFGGQVLAGSILGQTSPQVK